MRRDVKESKGQTLLHIVLDREQIRLGVAAENWERGADNSTLAPFFGALCHEPTGTSEPVPTGLVIRRNKRSEANCPWTSGWLSMKYLQEAQK